jgi:ABC-type multidrug transport system ATPase subunit
MVFFAQDDVLHPHLTVRERLAFCGMLRLAVADALIADTIVGNAFVRGVSSGEREHVNIAHELLVKPSLLVLDEPTSDSTAASRLVPTLSALSRKERLVLLSVHQPPSSRVYQTFDSVLLLAEGSQLAAVVSSD